MRLLITSVFSLYNAGHWAWVRHWFDLILTLPFPESRKRLSSPSSSDNNGLSCQSFRWRDNICRVFIASDKFRSKKVVSSCIVSSCLVFLCCLSPKSDSTKKIVSDKLWWKFFDVRPSEFWSLFNVRGDVIVCINHDIV